MSNGNETAKGMGRRRGPMGGRGMAPGEKPKDLKGAIVTPEQAMMLAGFFGCCDSVAGMITKRAAALLCSRSFL